MALTPDPSPVRERGEELVNRAGDLPSSSHATAYDTSTNVMKAYYVKSKYPDPKIKLFIRFLKARFNADYDWECRNQAL